MKIFLYAALLIGIGIIFQSCSADDETSLSNDKVKLSLCHLVSDDSSGEIWEILENATVAKGETIKNILQMIEPGYEADSVDIPMIPYSYLIICFDINNRPLFALAQKSSGKCIRISSFEIRDEKIFIGGDKVFENIVYSDRVELAEHLRELFPKH
jgi:hypothetical protein